MIVSDMTKIALIILALLMAAGQAAVRLAPSDIARWHTDPARGVTGTNSHVARAYFPMGPAEALAAFDRVAMAEPRTSRLAGSPEEGRITYVSRSRGWGFPDYTTVGTVPDGEGVWLNIYARARFGRDDFGVNAARVERWLSAIPGYDPGPRPVS
jgi:uncharacterized protein (DUF1499 family)